MTSKMSARHAGPALALALCAAHVPAATAASLPRHGCSREAEQLANPIVVFSQPSLRAGAVRLSAGDHFVYRCRATGAWTQILYTRRPVDCSSRQRQPSCPMGWVIDELRTLTFD